MVTFETAPTRAVDHALVVRHSAARSCAACAEEARTAAPNASGLERCQVLCASAAVEGLGTARGRASV